MPKFIKTAELHKLGFNPESFTRVGASANRQFIQNYERDSFGEKTRHSFITPWTILLGALGFYTSQKSKSKADRPDSIIPFLAASLVAIIGIKRWSAASKNERRRFVKSYNRAMGTTYQVEHPKMQAFWNMAHAKKNRVNHMGKYSEYYPDRVYQTPGYDTNAEWRKMRSVPTSIAIRRLGEEWVDRKPPKGVYKESRIPVRVHGHSPRGLYKYSTFFDDVNKHWNYAKYLGGHKYQVYKAGREIGVPRLKLLGHDLSKLRPDEWGPYADYWYGQKGIRSPGGPTPAVRKRFRAAARKHYGRNPHHAYRFGKPYTVDTELESLADWYAVSRFQHQDTSNKAFPPFRKWLKDRGYLSKARMEAQKRISV